MIEESSLGDSDGLRERRPSDAQPGGRSLEWLPCPPPNPAAAAVTGARGVEDGVQSLPSATSATPGVGVPSRLLGATAASASAAGEPSIPLPAAASDNEDDCASSGAAPPAAPRNRALLPAALLWPRSGLMTCRLERRESSCSVPPVVGDASIDSELLSEVGTSTPSQPPPLLLQLLPLLGCGGGPPGTGDETLRELPTRVVVRA
jgi:hypothetical protein